MDDITARPAAHDAVVVHPKGRLNMAVAPVLRKQLMDLIEQGDTRVVVNMVDVDTIDSAILGSLLAALKVARNAGGDLRLVAPSEQTQQVLKMTSLADVFRTYDSVDTAFESE